MRIEASFSVIALISLSSTHSVAATLKNGPPDPVQYQGPTFRTLPGSPIADATVVMNLDKRALTVSFGQRPVRWNAATGEWIELDLLGTNLSSKTESQVYALNSTGSGVGYATKYTGTNSSRGERPVLWNTVTGAVKPLDLLGSDGDYSNGRAYALNNVNTAVGYVTRWTDNADKGFRAVRWDLATGAALELQHLGLDNFATTTSYANAVNDSGIAIGHALKYVAGSNKGKRATSWNTTTGAVVELQNLGEDTDGKTTSEALALNPSGIAVGFSTRYESLVWKGSRAMRWNAATGAGVELQPLSVYHTGQSLSCAFDINDAGTAVGWARRWDGAEGNRAVRWDAATGEVEELVHLTPHDPQHIASQANAINNSGIVVGWVSGYVGPDLIQKRAVYWDEQGNVVSLTSLLPENSGWHYLGEAMGISETNWITGTGIYDPNPNVANDHYLRTFMIQVPEPASLGLLATGSLLLRRRRPTKS